MPQQPHLSIPTGPSFPNTSPTYPSSSIPVSLERSNPPTSNKRPRLDSSGGGGLGPGGYYGSGLDDPSPSYRPHTSSHPLMFTPAHSGSGSATGGNPGSPTNPGFFSQGMSFVGRPPSQQAGRPGMGGSAGSTSYSHSVYPPSANPFAALLGAGAGASAQAAASGPHHHSAGSSFEALEWPVHSSGAAPPERTTSAPSHHAYAGGPGRPSSSTHSHTHSSGSGGGPGGGGGGGTDNPSASWLDFLSNTAPAAAPPASAVASNIPAGQGSSSGSSAIDELSRSRPNSVVAVGMGGGSMGRGGATSPSMSGSKRTRSDDSGVGGEASIAGASSLPHTLANGNGNGHVGAEGDGHSDISGS